MATLDVMVETISDALLQAIEDQTGGGSLSEVQAVVRGDRSRPMPKLPAIWVVPQAATMARKTYDDETWDMPVSIAALVKSDDPSTASTTAQRLASLARSAVLALRPADVDPGVVDIVSVSFDPAARSSERNRTLFWTEAVIQVTFSVTE